MNSHRIGSTVKIDQGFDRFTIGVVKAHGKFVTPRGIHGVGYSILATGGTDCFGKPAEHRMFYVRDCHVQAN